MNTWKLIKLTRFHWSLLGLALLGAALSLASPTARRFVRHHAAALSAALLGQPHAAPGQTAAAVAPVNATFTVRSYGGKCLEFGVPLTRIEQVTGKSYPVFISDCKGTAVQQVRIEELTDRPGHLVILRAGSGVIGKKVTPVFTQLTASEAQSDNGSNDTSSAEQASSAALVFTSTADQIPLEVQPYTGSEGQIFALDGDSMILASDRNLVIEVQHHRGANGTPLVLGRRDLDDSEFWDFIATDGSAQRPTTGFVRVPADSDPNNDGFEFKQAVAIATPGTVIEIDPDASIDLSDQNINPLDQDKPFPILIGAGVTIRGDRRGTLPGPELTSLKLRDEVVKIPGPDVLVKTSNARNGMLAIDGNDVRITGLRLRGPSRSTESSTPKAIGIVAHDNLYTRSIIDHNELSDWSETAVLVTGGEEAKSCTRIRDHRDNPTPYRPTRAENVRVVRNFIHHNQRQNGGYGVGTYDSAFPLIEGNTFVSNRHAIASDGSTRTGYRAWYNLVLSQAPLQKKAGGLYTWHTHDFDMHGTGKVELDLGLGQIELTSGFGGTGGEYVEIARNTFLGTNRANFDLRGEPCYLAEFHHNVSLKSYTKLSLDLPGGVDVTRVVGAIECSYCGGGINKLKVYDNQFNAPNPTNRLGVGDFDGDGKDDLFLATGAAWYYAPAGQAEWRFLNAQTDKIGTLLFGDFDGDRRTDVFTQHEGSKWDVSWGGASKWETINGSGPLLGNAAIGDFNGDGRADVFYTDGAQWLVSYSGTGAFTHMALAIHRVADLRFGDFNRDGKTDVFGVVGDSWMVVYGGTQFWAPLRAKLSDSVTDLTVADFDGDGRADVARSNPLLRLWLVSRGGTGDWTRLRAGSPPLSSVPAIGRFDGAPGADVLTWAPSNTLLSGALGPNNALNIASGGAGAAQRHSRQDLR